MNKEYIEREAALKNLAKSYFAGVLDDLIHAEDAVTAVPAADVVEVRHGCWRKVDIGADGKHHYKYACSVCHMCVPPNLLGYDDKLRYCPNCGAKMDGERKGGDGDACT